MTPRPLASQGPLTPTADRRRVMPETHSARTATSEGALASLRREEARLERLGLERPLHRCREELRFWSFVNALHALPRVSRPRAVEAVEAWSWE